MEQLVGAGWVDIPACIERETHSGELVSGRDCLLVAAMAVAVAEVLRRLGRGEGCSEVG